MTFRPVYGGLRSAQWLRAHRHGPAVYGFRNLESGQVVWSQTLHPQAFNIDQQFSRPNWQNRKPTVRKDIWRPLAVAQVKSHEDAVSLYRSLVELRAMRDVSAHDQARNWRRKSPEGNIWYWNQYRPTYTSEAVADLSSALFALDKSSKVWWDGEYRRGDDSVWEDIEVEHDVLPRHNPREQHVVLNQIRTESLEQAEEPVPYVRTEEDEQLASRRSRSKAAQSAERMRLLESRPDLQELERLREAVVTAEQALAKAEAEYDHFLPHGQRGAAKAPIKLRKSALAQAKRVYRQAKKRHAARNNKRRVSQPRVRMR